MALNEAASADRVHIGFFGMRNAGKSSLVNAVTNQEVSLVSDVLGTTTDPVRKAMELLPLGPVVIIDTPGLDDEGELGLMRVKRAKQVLNFIDIAILVLDATVGMSAQDRQLLDIVKKKKIPYILVYNKSDLSDAKYEESENSIFVSAEKRVNIEALKEKMAHLLKNDGEQRHIVADLISERDTVVLVIPIDESAPKGRLILPQQQTMRDVLDSGATVIACRDTELAAALQKLNEPPRLVITDSQAFGRVSRIVPDSVPLTSFSILFARYKGNLERSLRGAAMLDELADGDKILISEGCTHHRQCGDIGTVKLPKWISEYTKKELKFEFTSGRDFPEDVSQYKLVIHCGGCMLTEREMLYRAKEADDAGVPMTNYGMVIAYVNGILKRSLEPFGDIANILK